jgi:Family of unknown function (DUF5871)
MVRILRQTREKIPGRCRLKIEWSLATRGQVVKMSGVSVPVASFSGSNLSVSQIKVRDNGSKSAYINYGGNKLRLQVGSLQSPYGMKDSTKFDPTGPVKYSVDLSLRGYDEEGSKAQQIYAALEAIDNFMLDQAEKNSQAWFKTKYTREVLKAFYTPCVKFSKDKQGNLAPWPPTVKVNLRQQEGKFEATIYDQSKKPLKDVPMEDILVKGAQVTMLIECTGVWFAGSKFGLSWKAVQIRVDQVPESIRDYAFEDDGGEAAPAAPAPKKASAPAPAPANQFAGLDDDEVDDDEALAAPPAPAASAAAHAPAPAAADDDDDVFDEAPAPVPAKKPVLTKKKVVAAVKK